tara:strand:- start:788 stop:1702 length:915 start_codon:yes stop_codon:yes gene_type:complete
MSKIRTYFSKRYEANTPTASMRKLRPVAEAAEKAGYAEIIKTSTSKGIENKLKKIHDPEYVDSFSTGVGNSKNSNGWDWTEEIRNGVFSINQGQLDAAKEALENGIAANVAQGFHHAGPEHGSGFCTFNGLALVASENPDKRVFVIDCDQHAGDGTSEFTEYMDNFAQVTINGSSFGCKENERTRCITLPRIERDFGLYEDALQEGFRIMDKFEPDLVIYQAGADPHINDPLGNLGMTTEQMYYRDSVVFSRLKNSNVPTMFVLAGGYQEPVKKKLVPLHLNTFKAAHEVYKHKARSPMLMLAQ